MNWAERFLEYITVQRRYSPRTRKLYGDVLSRYEGYAGEYPASLTPALVRSYEVHLLDAHILDARTVNLHLSVLSSFCRYLIRQGELESNPVRVVSRPRVPRKLPVFYRDESMEEYFRQSAYYAGEDSLKVLQASSGKARNEIFLKRSARMIVSMLYSTGIRRFEIISLKRDSLDLSRRILRVRGKGDKMREIPLPGSLCEELSLYLQAADLMTESAGPDSPLFITPAGGPIYPVFVDRAVKSELGEVGSISGKKSPHVLRHTLATQLLDAGSDLNSIKELLGHSSLAATQVYTHNTVERLKNVYQQAHPRAKKEGENGDKD